MPAAPIEVLRKVPLFSGLPEVELLAFSELVRERSYPKGSVILFEDDPGDALYLVAVGSGQSGPHRGGRTRSHPVGAR